MLLMAAWGAGEAVVFPLVPDVLLYLLAAVVPRRAAALFAWALAGAVGGTALLYALAIAAPEAATSLVLAVPGIDRTMLDATTVAVAGGDPTALAMFGPGTPLKVYTLAWALGPGGPAGLLVGMILNRLTRIGPGLVIAALLGYVAPRWLRRHDRPILSAYAIAWIVLYAVYLGAR